MRRLRERAAHLAVIAVILAVASCGSSGSTTTATSTAGLAEQTQKVGEVEVKARPTSLDPSAAAFLIILDTHSGDLDVDIAATSRLEINGGATSGAPTWDGAPAGGHHREGTLRFPLIAAPTGTMKLTVGGLAAPAVFVWNLGAQ